MLRASFEASPPGPAAPRRSAPRAAASCETSGLESRRARISDAPTHHG
jgi:hypothetical protein